MEDTSKESSSSDGMITVTRKRRKDPTEVMEVAESDQTSSSAAKRPQYPPVDASRTVVSYKQSWRAAGYLGLVTYRHVFDVCLGYLKIRERRGWGETGHESSAILKTWTCSPG